MVHTQFVWSHGGNQVFLCGDFTGWVKYQQMVPVEGSAMTFVTICDLPPGYHKFKFLVDGVWRVDHQQFFKEDEDGMNNIILVKPPEIMIQPLVVDDSGLPIMDIDGLDDHHHAHNASTSSNIPHETFLPLRAEDIETTRNRLSQHLSSYQVDELIPDSGKVFALDANLSVEDAFLIMHAEGLAVAPLWDEANHQISGMLTASDFIMILMELQRNHAMVVNRVLEVSSISAWKEGKLQLQRRPLIKVDPDETLNAVAYKILHNHISSVPVIYVAQGATFPQLLHVACLSGLLKHINRHFEYRVGYLPLLQQPIGSLPIGSWIRDIGGARELLMLLSHEPLSDALRLLLDEHISSVPIVDSKGTLVNIFSRSDITSLAKGNVYARIQLDRATVAQALQLVDMKAHSRFETCTRYDTLQRVITLLSDPVRRVVVVEGGTQRMLGLITLRDVFSLIFIDSR
ncbi:putative AMP-activated kinase, glycogen-binding protein [Helianthus annuus]|nr:putative AMP-activated kinase, glycogen-binding protein [Helianthus annuus]